MQDNYDMLSLWILLGHKFCTSRRNRFVECGNFEPRVEDDLMKGVRDCDDTLSQNLDPPVPYIYA